MKNDEQDDLWELLGRAKAPHVSPFFSRNVLRAIRAEEQEKPLALWFRWRWLTLSASACGMVVAAIIAFQHVPTPQISSAPVVAQQSQPPEQPLQTQEPAQVSQPDQVAVLAQQVSASPDYQVINHLDELLASEETSVWLDK
jgi:cytochrome c-type biogenesis protein CcmH/NrfG